MWAAMIHYSHPPRAVAKCDQLLAEQHQPERGTAALNFRAHQRRNPVFPHQLTHDSAWTDPRQLNAIDWRCHPILLRLTAAVSAHRTRYSLPARGLAAPTSHSRPPGAW